MYVAAVTCQPYALIRHLCIAILLDMQQYCAPPAPTLLNGADARVVVIAYMHKGKGEGINMVMQSPPVS